MAESAWDTNSPETVKRWGKEFRMKKIKAAKAVTKPPMGGVKKTAAAAAGPMPPMPKLPRAPRY
jgi:hypothetical protein